MLKLVAHSNKIDELQCAELNIYPKLLDTSATQKNRTSRRYKPSRHTSTHADTRTVCFEFVRCVRCRTAARLDARACATRKTGAVRLRDDFYRNLSAVFNWANDSSKMATVLCAPRWARRERETRVRPIANTPRICTNGTRA